MLLTYHKFNIYIHIGPLRKLEAEVKSSVSFNIMSQRMNKKHICWVNGTTNNYTLNTSSIEVGGLRPDTVYSIGCVEVDDNGDYQCAEYNTTVVTGEKIF